ncbi:hypothetical protein DD237_001789 [Peronospora effusa]|uniref:Uncharacterized protein n=1 Tax=Peronospora effusa TaxID=542832 RepID=A0A425CN30_9STRA|nr:hypothetical protein DD237_001789 [Peronospora effusa]
MASFLLGDEYASSSSDDETSLCTSSNMNTHPPVATTFNQQLLPSADELFSTNNTSSVLTTRISSALASTNKRKNDQMSRPATKAVKLKTGKAVSKPKIAPFAPPQLRRPNISTEDSSSWTTNKTLMLQKKAKEAQARERQT